MPWRGKGQGDLFVCRLKFYSSDNTEGERYAGKRDLQSLIEFIGHKLHDAEKDEEEEIVRNYNSKVLNNYYKLHSKSQVI